MERYIVIGAGILGASAAYHLAKEGKRVTVIDRGDKGQATDAGAGIICPWLSQRRNQKWYELVRKGAAFYPSLIEELNDMGETETGYYRSGAVSLHYDQFKVDDTAARAVKRREDAPEIGSIEKLDAKETQKKFPLVSDEYISLYVSGGARVNGRDLRNSLLQAAEKFGAVRIYGHAEPLRDKDKVHQVRVGSEIFTADKLLVTAGAWAARITEKIKAPMYVRAQKGQILHLHMPHVNNFDWPVVLPPKDYYMLHFGKGHIVAGASREDDQEYDTEVTVGAINEILTKILTVAPGLKHASLVETRVGTRPFTADSLPVIGKVPGLNNVYTANGLGATGLTSGPFLGEQLAKKAMEQGLNITEEHYDIAHTMKNG
ncbi:NAD(P)/FAD-dependent oxidoreductase [Salisediminibacterium halotolerans]|uniref:D-amino-acid dehydrogenase n=1 Tax=Salisediminibacterium halotolerans TaxID=517425 RepID=A0A1H9RPR0_9BACI|nr:MULTISPECIES: FAD-dependent oxidoreductase [Salisediminibacterium]RLJ81010.1 D-amino acid dehydrogenase small subunit [Actinophytocola xinjiangensis]RPE87900.1 D-amino acid dehydrogenase small subunit [Salisediminibacterium halotolerans]TWG37903.1 D-amino acid dehydrogenase small subunit [Salisediminibacterium halotolerans]SER73879.1 D-amino-acid dehydrogenase [Salisediminibacterium haloalkalitolerans]GEL08346.1 oxidoreductase [Salisediminibacterium halotolerans]